MSKRNLSLLLFVFVAFFDTKSLAIDLSTLMQGGDGSGGGTVKNLFFANTSAGQVVFPTLDLVSEFKTPHGVVTFKLEFERKDAATSRPKQHAKRQRDTSADASSEVVSEWTQREPLLPMKASFGDLVEELERKFEEFLPENLRKQVFPSENELMLSAMKALPEAVQEKAVETDPAIAKSLVDMMLAKTNLEISRQKAIHAYLTGEVFEITQLFVSHHGRLKLSLKGNNSISGDLSAVTRVFPDTWEEAKTEIVTGFTDYLESEIEKRENGSGGNMFH